MSATREERILGIIETARGKQSKFKDEHITMSHGAGGKATPVADRGPAAARLRQRGASASSATPAP